MPNLQNMSATSIEYRNQMLVKRENRSSNGKLGINALKTYLMLHSEVIDMTPNVPTFI